VSDTSPLADPDVEPTDAQLVDLSRRAFANVAAKREAAFAAVLAAIERARVRAMTELDARAPGESPAK
jgi:hypothetical protein